MVNLRDLIQDIEYKKIVGPLDREILGIEHDSRRVEKGFMFVAIKGINHDGHEFIAQAQDRGAEAIILEHSVKEIRTDPSVTYIEVDDTKRALALLGARFYSYPSQCLSLIGITGTNGKTTISYLIESILTAAGHQVGVIGTITYRWGKEARSMGLTTPDALELQTMLRSMVDNGTEYGILEVSSHALKLKRVDGCCFRSAIFTNLTRDHLDFHGTMEDYFASKKRLFCELSLEQAIINRDNMWGQRLLAELPSTIPLLTYGIEKPSSIHNQVCLWPEKITSNWEGIYFLAQTPAGAIPLRSSLIGTHNIYNILASVGTALKLNVSPDHIQQGIENLRVIPGRLEKIDLGQDFAVLVDYAHTPDALAQVLQSLKQLSQGRLITVFGCGGNRDKTKRAVMGEIAASNSQLTIITSDNPRNEDPLEIITEIVNGVKRVVKTKDHYEIIPQRSEAIYRAISLARAGDMVIIAGKGHETYQIIGEEIISFDDREVAKAALQEKLDGRSVCK
jgi:UDP-N-acetylmuramoyl-L-alanyl-D-glutamate--2,6-diaminopimelate ligase